MRQLTYWGQRLLYLGLLLTPILTSHAEVSLHDLDTMVERWMQLRTTIADEKREWGQQKEQWQTEIALLEQESTNLEAEIAKASTFVSSVEKDRSVALEQKEHMQKELQQLEVVIAQAEDELRHWETRIPGGLRKHVPGYDVLPESRQESAHLPLTKRSQTVAVIHAQIEALQNQVHVTQEMLDTGTARRQVDVLYMGLSIAYAVSPANDWAAIGTPSGEKWIWRTANKDAKAVRQAINVYNRQESAKLIPLPLQVTREVSQ